MIDLSRPNKPRKHDPNAVELAALIITIGVWVYMIISAMM